jgi:hypothetical protein
VKDDKSRIINYTSEYFDDDGGFVGRWSEVRLVPPLVSIPDSLSYLDTGKGKSNYIWY